MKKVHTLIIGSGAAGLCAAVRLRAEGVDDILIATEGLDMGTSINTGSDKQTYYKLSLCGDQSDSPRQMAETLFNGGSMHGDIALVEASLSARCFLHLVDLGVKFPTDAYGQFVGYKTDHDPRQRATSVGPYTSRDMCRALIRRVKELEIPVWERVCCVELLKVEQDGQDRVCGAIFIDEKNEIVPVIAENVVFAVGGPGGLYENSVYPKCHTGAIGLALAIGAEAQNLPESQFGMASTKFRWNVSGTYMQVIPRFVSTDENGNDQREFLLEYFDDLGDLHSKIFLKGYQWPFDVCKVITKSRGHSAAPSPDPPLNGSSIIDILVYIETVERNRRVFLDYRSNPAGLDFGSLEYEAKCYLEKSGALFGTPIQRLETMNPGAIELYANNGIDLRNEMLEIAVCAQHNNGGLAGTIWWESTNIKHLFPVGEVNGSHGVARPGGSALNSGQVGAFRAAEFIANRYKSWTLDIEAINKIVQDMIEVRAKERDTANITEKEAIRKKSFLKRIRHTMSTSGGFVKRWLSLLGAVSYAGQLYNEIGYRITFEDFQTANLALAAVFYLDAALFCLKVGHPVGSRGSSLALGSGPGEGIIVHMKLGDSLWNMLPEDESFREKVLVSHLDTNTGQISHRWESRRPIPDAELWFEAEWKKYRDGEIYDK